MWIKNQRVKERKRGREKERKRKKERDIQTVEKCAFKVYQKRNGLKLDDQHEKHIGFIAVRFSSLDCKFIVYK